MPAGVMQPAVLIRLRPTGPWRYGPGDGASDRVDTVYRSDRVYSAVTVTMQQLGYLEEWLDATARNTLPAVAFSSLYPYQGDTLFATPPASVWPPPTSQLTAPNPAFLNKIRWNAVQFVPLSVIESLLAGRSIPAEQWTADPVTGCLLRRDRPGSTPFRVSVRTAGAVDRVTRGTIEVSSAACVEFEPDAGLWTVARYRNGAAASAWQDRLQACFRLLADSGFGGRRTHGWGKTDVPEFKRGTWPGVLFPKLGRTSEEAEGGEPSLFWLLSLYSPAQADKIDWTGGDYRLTLRGGRVESKGQTGLLKKNARMVTEGSVLAADAEPTGMAINVAPDNFGHPVYRSGFALALKLPLAKVASDFASVETPTEEEALGVQPGEEEAEAISIAAGEDVAEEPQDQKLLASPLIEDERPVPSGVEEILGEIAAAQAGAEEKLERPADEDSPMQPLEEELQAASVPTAEEAAETPQQEELPASTVVPFYPGETSTGTDEEMQHPAESLDTSEAHRDTTEKAADEL
jgi:CRISPR type III-A-associated RAMP protein Csm4